MARARSIKPGFFRNADLVELPMEARLLFIGLWTLADRAGRLEDRPKQIKMDVFPADSVDVDDLLEQLAGRNMVARYEIGGTRYLQVVNFAKHQNPHRDEKASTLPDQEGNTAALMPAPKAHSANTVQTQCKTDAGTVAILLTPDSGLLTPDSPMNTPHPPKGGRVRVSKVDEPEGFGEFWRLCPRKDAKQDAMKAFVQVGLHESVERREAAMTGLRRWAVNEQWTKDKGKFIPLPASWLRGERWLDQAVAGTASAGAGEAPEWVVSAGFDSAAEAGNFRCYAHNAHEFSKRQRVVAPTGAQP